MPVIIYLISIFSWVALSFFLTFVTTVWILWRIGSLTTTLAKASCTWVLSRGNPYATPQFLGPAPCFDRFFCAMACFKPSTTEELRMASARWHWNWADLWLQSCWRLFWPWPVSESWREGKACLLLASFWIGHFLDHDVFEFVWAFHLLETDNMIYLSFGMRFIILQPLVVSKTVRNFAIHALNVTVFHEQIPGKWRQTVFRDVWDSIWSGHSTHWKQLLIVITRHPQKIFCKFSLRDVPQSFRTIHIISLCL